MNHRAMFTMRLAAGAVAAIILSGCVVGPDYHRPDVRMPDRYAGAQTSATTPSAEENARWWDSLNDPTLTRLIDRSVATGLDAQLALSRVREARALYAFRAGQLYPTLDAASSFQRSRYSENRDIGPLAGSTNNLFQAGFDAAWELDVFGGFRRSVESASATVESTVEAQRDTTLTLISEVARNYVVLRGSQLERATVAESLRGQEDTLELLRAKAQAGNIPDLDVFRQEAQVASTASQLPMIEATTKQAAHRLSVLLGLTPTSLYQELLPDAPIPAGPADVPTGMPSDLLRRRPDIRRAERRMAAASAEIGVAVADLFPKFSLTGSFGVESDALRTLTRSDSRFWSFGPAVNWRLFEGGRLQANVVVQKERFEQASIEYRQTILVALSEVEDALVLLNRESARRNALKLAVDANVQALDRAKQLNKAGVIDFLDVLTSEQALLLSRQQLAQSQQSVSVHLIALFKSLGGGWEAFEPPSPGASATSGEPSSSRRDRRQRRRNSAVRQVPKAGEPQRH